MESQIKPGQTVIFYDGVCGLCNHFVKFVLSNSQSDQFVFASLQSQFAEQMLNEHGVKAADLNSIYVVSNYDQEGSKLLSKSDAVVHIAKKLKNPLPIFATIISIVPKPIRDFGYSIVAKFRYKIFGKFDTCLLPSSEEAEKFIEV